MIIAITSRTTGRMTSYTPKELQRDARAACRGKGKLETYWVNFNESGHASLIVQYKCADGWSESMSIAILGT
jgi:hypothetical protein